jgi:two-component system, chemotaxis family, chemotaxis protein CheY
MQSIEQKPAPNIDEQIRALKVLIVDDEHYSRKVIHGLLTAIGVRQILEASDGLKGLDAIRSHAPDIVIVDWEMPGLNGTDFTRVVRSPGTFPYPDVPIIMLTGHAERSLVVAAVKVGVNEYILKPVSSQGLRARIVSVLTKPRNIVQKKDYYGPEPRKLSSYKPEKDSGFDNIVLVN